MNKYSFQVIKNGFILMVEVFGWDDLQAELKHLRVRGFEPVQLPIGVAQVNPQKREPERPICMCPDHGNTDIRTDKNKGGYYCGVKRGDKWCGCHFDKDGSVDRLPYSHKKEATVFDIEQDHLGFLDD